MTTPLSASIQQATEELNKQRNGLYKSYMIECVNAGFTEKQAQIIAALAVQVSDAQRSASLALF